MSHKTRITAKNIVLKIGDRSKTIQGVSEKTTCSDVIKMVLRNFNNTKENTHSYAIFECGNGQQRMLSGKRRVLKTMRIWGPGNINHFSLKTIRKHEIFKAKRDKTGKSQDELNNLDLSLNEVASATKLADLIQTQKARLQRHLTKRHVTGTCDDGETSKHEFVSTGVENKMADFQNFSGSVTANGRVRLSETSDSSTANERVGSEGMVTGTEIRRQDKINDIRYATKKSLKPKKVLVAYGRTDSGMARKHTFINCESRNAPMHSTPNRRELRPPNLKRHGELADDISAKVAKLDQREGKNVILQKYFADYLSYNSPSRKPFQMPKRESGDGAEDVSYKGNPDKGDVAFSADTPVLRKAARVRHHSDSDSGHEDHEERNEDDLDNATVSGAECKNRYDDTKPLSRKLVNYDITITTEVDKLVDYSLSASSLFESDENTVDILERNIIDEDNEMASFMVSKLHDDFSDEGLSSLGSNDDREIFV